MKAMIFAAGLGTRLRPLTDDKPKALVEVAGMTLLEATLRRLKYFGFREIAINIHYHGQQVIDFLESRQQFGLDIHLSDERSQLLDTGGGLKKAAAYFQDAPFLVHNVDILSRIDLKALCAAQRESGAMATLAVSQRPSSRHLLFDEEGQLAGWRHNRNGEERICRKAEKYHPLAFSGIYVLSPGIFRYMPKEKAVFSIIDTLLAAGGPELIQAFVHDSADWLDVGKPEALEKAETLLPTIPLA